MSKERVIGWEIIPDGRSGWHFGLMYAKLARTIAKELTRAGISFRVDVITERTA